MMKIKPKKINAIISLNPTAIFGMVDDEIQNYEPKDEQPTESAIQSKLVELISDWDSQEYARNRAGAYDSIGNQLDLLFHDMTAGKGTKSGEWYKAVAKVKSDNPKG
jgi:hypothetical protein